MFTPAQLEDIRRYNRFYARHVRKTKHTYNPAGFNDAARKLVARMKQNTRGQLRRDLIAILEDKTPHCDPLFTRLTHRVFDDMVAYNIRVKRFL